MKQIILTQGYVAQVSDRDYERVNKFKWSAQVIRRKDGTILNVYAVRGFRIHGKQHTQKLHRFILGVTASKVQIDHSPDPSGLNCQRENLRIATHAENNHNQRLSVNNTSGIKGVCWHKARQKWQARIMVNGKTKHLGYFISLADAREAYDKAAKKYHGAFALTNTMLEDSAALVA